MSHPEASLWQRKRGMAAGFKFHRRSPISPLWRIFYCASAKLLILVEGEILAQPTAPEHDVSRDRFLADDGFRLIRIPAADILRDADAAAVAIGSLVAAPLRRPSDGPPSQAGEDQE